MSINWDDPVQRCHLIERVGVDTYSQMFKEHQDRSVIERVNGHAIRAINSPRFGRIYMVDGLGRGHSTLEGARKIALGTL